MRRADAETLRRRLAFTAGLRAAEDLRAPAAKNPLGTLGQQLQCRAIKKISSRVTWRLAKRR